MLYVKIELDYGRTYAALQKKLLENSSLTPVLWDGDHLAFSHREVIIPIKLAEVLGGGKLIASYTSEELAPAFDDKILFNEKTKSAVPNSGLMAITEVRVLEDCCTNALQNELNEGWCIIAVCPQPQRRPDYVLARRPQEMSIISPQTSVVSPNSVPETFDDDIPF